MDADIVLGDCLEVLREFPDACIDAVVTDPPYGLSKEPNAVEVLNHWIAGHDYQHRGGGFMGKAWDSFVPGPSVWREVLRVLKPGGHVLSFFGTRTYDLGVTAMRLAGFEIRDQLAWMYGSGFPKSLDYAADVAESHKQGRRVVKHEFVGHPQEEGFGTALKPAQEPIVLARKPLIGTVAANVLAHGTGGLSVDGCRIEGVKGVPASMPKTQTDATSWATRERPAGDGQDPNVGRWPANVLLDEHAAALLDEQSGVLKSGRLGPGHKRGSGATSYDGGGGVIAKEYGNDSGGASRFFYVAKASRSEREAGLETPTEGRANHHPTVKPIALMRYLCRLITPPGGYVLDPYVGSGTTALAAVLEGFQCVGIEQNPDYVSIARARLTNAIKTH